MKAEFSDTYSAAVVSTAHLTGLQNGQFESGILIGTFDSLKYGYRLYIGDGEDSIDWMPDGWDNVRAIALAAHEQGFSYLIFDQDGPDLNEFPTFDW